MIWALALASAFPFLRSPHGGASLLLCTRTHMQLVQHAQLLCHRHGSNTAVAAPQNDAYCCKIMCRRARCARSSTIRGSTQ